MGRMKKDDKTVCSTDKFVFVEYNGEWPACAYCIFADSPDVVCDTKKCRDYEREDGKNGYYRAANVTKLSHPEPKGGIQ